LQVWSSLPTAEVLAQAAANTVRPALNTRGSAYAAAVAAGLDPQLLYDYRCRVLNMVKAHYGESAWSFVACQGLGFRIHWHLGLELYWHLGFGFTGIPVKQVVVGLLSEVGWAAELRLPCSLLRIQRCKFAAAECCQRMHRHYTSTVPDLTAHCRSIVTLAAEAAAVATANSAAADVF
jgi:hypothetical protein